MQDLIKHILCGYSDKKYSEIDLAKDLAEKLEIKNINKVIEKEEYISSISKALYHMDEPCLDPSAISLYLLSKLASQDVKVVISGEGADEFFGGYNYYLENTSLKLYNKVPYCIRHVLSKCFSVFPDFKGRNFIVRKGNKLEEEYVGVNKVFSEKERRKVLSIEDNIRNKDIIQSSLYNSKDENNIVKMQRVDIENWLSKDILLKVDKMTMANSIESRTPFVDKEVFKIASMLPIECKISNNTTKVALRKAAKKDIPNESYKKKKLGFPVPLREWMREEDLYNEIKNTINQDFVKEFFNQKYILKLLENHKKHKQDNYRKVWTIYIFIKWYEVYFR